MGNYDRVSELRVEANAIYSDILAMQLLMTQSIDQLIGTVYLDLSPAGKLSVKDTQDRIFGYRIEMEAMHVRALKLLEIANTLESSDDQ